MLFSFYMYCFSVLSYIISFLLITSEKNIILIFSFPIGDIGQYYIIKKDLFSLTMHITNTNLFRTHMVPLAKRQHVAVLSRSLADTEERLSLLKFCLLSIPGRHWDLFTYSMKEWLEI